jgi:hypothetical protein
MGKKQEKRQYHLKSGALAEAYDRFADSGQIKSLSEEVALLRALLQERLTLIDNSSLAVAATDGINNIVKSIERLEMRSFELEQKSNRLLPKATLFKLADQIVALLLSELKSVPNSEHVIDSIATKLAKLIEDAE